MWRSCARGSHHWSPSNSSSRLDSTHLSFDPRRELYRDARASLLESRGWLTVAVEHAHDLAGRDNWPELLPRYLAMYAGRAYLSDELVQPVQKQVRRLGDAHGVGARPVHFLEPQPEPQQLSLLA